jgi:hypothetical protein
MHRQRLVIRVVLDEQDRYGTGHQVTCGSVDG